MHENPKHESFIRLKMIVDSYLQESKIKRRGAWQLYVKGTFLLFIFFSLYFTILCLGKNSYCALLVLSGLYGISMATLQFNIMHDASHGAFSTKRWVNKLASNVMMLAGASSKVWHQQHVRQHHLAPCVLGVDTDVDQAPFFIFHPKGRRRWFHRYQAFYALPVYSLLSIFWTPKDILASKNSKSLYLNIFIATTVCLILNICIPFIALQSIPKVVMFFLFYNFSLGITLSLVFVPAHICSTVSMFLEKEANEKKVDFISAQTLTTSDFNPQSKLINFFTGGLNNQVSHHLFPGVCHLHYPKIQLIIEKFCHEKYIKYNKFPTFKSAIIDHFQYIHRLGASGR